MTRIVYGSVNGERELKGTGLYSSSTRKSKEFFPLFQATYLEQIENAIDPLEDIASLIRKHFVDDPPVTLERGWNT